MASPPCIYNPLFQQGEMCTLVQLVPRLSYYPSEEFFPPLTPTSAPLLTRREPISALTVAVLLGLGAAGAGTGISSLALSSKRYDELSTTIDWDVQKLQAGITDLADSLRSLSKVVLQNRRGLYLLLLQQVGLCAALKEECCFYVDKTGLVKDAMKEVREGLERRKLGRAKNKSWYQDWLSTSPWVITLNFRTFYRAFVVNFFWPLGI
ncbi:Envelope glycoprotein [Cricetulus griseus]|uniref:Envelope glycoprotein n=1 Tax=Cricetulus griseus TaxID=10029 RepID=G3HCD7_CRIGR|nr:Envelope glycoprotein [Cricetulus griseus]